MLNYRLIMNSNLSSPSSNGDFFFSTLSYLFFAVIFFYIGRNFDELKQRLIDAKTLQRTSKVFLLFL